MKSNLNKSDYVVFIFLLFITILSRYLIVGGEYHLYGWDPGNYALATKSYSILNTRPHWPGYYLHVKTIELVNYFFNDIPKSMTILSMTYSGLGISFFYFLIRNWYNRKDSILISFILLTNPLVWYYGCLEEIYPFELFFSALLILLFTKNKLIYLTPIIMVIGSGIRPSSGVLLFPLYIFLWYSFYTKHKKMLKYIVFSQIIGILFLISWFLPLTYSVGGVLSYFELYITHSPIQQITFFQNLGQFLIYLTFPMFGVVIGLLIFLLFKLFYKEIDHFMISDNNHLYHKNLKMLLIYWVVPPTSFFVFFHYSKGTLILCLAGIVLLLPFVINNFKFSSIYYVVLIIIQTIYFMFAVYKPPNEQTYFNRSSRNIGLYQVLWERLHSNYLLSISNINYLQDEFNIINQIINDYKSDKTYLYTSKKYIFIDPTITISPRALQFEYSNIQFVKISPRTYLAYGILSGNDLKNGYPLKNALANSIIISKSNFVDHYLNSITKIYKNYKHIKIYIPRSHDIVHLEKIYSQKFYW